MVTLESFTDDVDQVEHLIKWWVSLSDNRYHRVRLRGSVRDFVHDVWVKLLSNFRDGKQVDCAISTAVCHQCCWTLSDPSSGCGEQTIRNFKYKMQTASRVKPYHKLDEEDHARLHAEQRELEDRIARLMRTLTYRQAIVVRARYGLFGDAESTLEEIGKVLKLSRERVRQLEGVGINKLKHHTRAGRLISFLDEEHIRSNRKRKAEQMQNSEYGKALFDELTKDDD